MEEKVREIKYIDIEKSIRERKSGILPLLPWFIIRILEKIVCQDGMNYILNKYSNTVGKEFLVKVIEELNLTLEIEGLENLPEHKKCFFAANHPFGIIDGLVLTHIVSTKYGELKAIANDAFMYVPQLRPFVAAVNVFDGSSKEYLHQLEETYRQDIPITHFPAGIVSRKLNGKIQDLPWQKSFISKSVSSQRDIVPMHFHGRNSRLFYFIHSARTVLGINLNLELALLPREMFNKRNKTIRVTIGKPIPYQTFDKSHTHLEWAQKVRAQVYGLGMN